LQAAQAESFGVVSLDWRLAGDVSGEEVLVRLRDGSRTGECAVLLLTASPDIRRTVCPSRLAVVRTASDDYDAGAFLLDRLGAQRHLDPPLMAVLLTLRRRLIDEYGATAAAELMLIDSADRDGPRGGQGCPQ
jgi:hypothetical protein